MIDLTPVDCSAGAAFNFSAEYRFYLGKNAAKFHPGEMRAANLKL
jgi:hypothetical protein